MSRKKHHRHVPHSEVRRGYYGGVYGASYAVTGGFLSQGQFGYSTAQDPDGDGDNDAGTASSGSSGDAAGAGSGGAT